MFLDAFSNSVLEPEDIIQLLYQGKTNVILQSALDISNVEIQQFLSNIDHEITDVNARQTLEQFDKNNQQWIYPEKYKNLDLKEILFSKCTTKQEYDRVDIEYAEFERRNLLDLLRWMMYIVDICNERQIVRGVGRGSSVASYILYLLGVHMIDPIKYDIDCNEFFK